jgi:hypothetical protein
MILVAIRNLSVFGFERNEIEMKVKALSSQNSIVAFGRSSFLPKSYVNSDLNKSESCKIS